MKKQVAIGTKSAPRTSRVPAPKRRILLVDDHPMTREGLAAVINREQDLEVCGLAGNPSETMTELSRTNPDLMITDMNMPGRSGIEFIKDIHAMVAALPILVLSMLDEMLYPKRALRAGASGYLMKEAGSAKVLEAIRLVLAGQPYVSVRMTQQSLKNLAGRSHPDSTSPNKRLSDREFEVFRLVGGGLSSNEIANELHISPKTVAAHRESIKAKLELKDGLSLIHYAVR